MGKMVVHTYFLLCLMDKNKGIVSQGTDLLFCQANILAIIH